MFLAQTGGLSKTEEGQVWEVPRSYDGFSCSSTSDVTENVRGRDVTSFPLWFESESILLLNSVTVIFLIIMIVAGGGTPESHYRSEQSRA